MLRLNVRKFLFTAVFMFAWAFAFSQEKVEMAEGLRSSGKIYVVVAVLAIIFIGLFIFLINIDRKVSRLEKENQKANPKG